MAKTNQPGDTPASPARNVLLAGAGDVCLRIARRLAAQGDQVWGLRRQPPAGDTDGIRWIAADLTRPNTLTVIPSAISHVIYAPSPDARDESAYRHVFVNGLDNLFDQLDHATLQRVVFLSSSAVYGDQGDEWVDEDTPVQPKGFNGRILVEAEKRLAAIQSDVVVLRLAGLYGPGRLQLLERLKNGQARVHTSGRQWANRLHVDDAARATVHVLGLQAPTPCYVVADDTPHHIGELYDQLAAMIGAPPVPRDERLAANTGRRLRNARLKASGFTPLWPDAIAGYRALLGEFRE
ncbi:MAG TPA: SDR family oxidoreductase [Burkholderiaceae bacterium]|nr:SDR family oxidoreductase [Burkholderiaceae bacterium]